MLQRQVGSQPDSLTGVCRWCMLRQDVVHPGVQKAAHIKHACVKVVKADHIGVKDDNHLVLRDLLPPYGTLAVIINELAVDMAPKHIVHVAGLAVDLACQSQCSSAWHEEHQCGWACLMVKLALSTACWAMDTF